MSLASLRDSALADLMVIGGGINGCGIARDAAGRGLRVVLAEKGDLGGATSSASTKLFHGGLRYLEYFEFRLVREALRERERLLQAMPHISRPMRFVLPYAPEMRFDAETPASRLVGRLMPWLRGRRPAWMIRAGLFLYDHLGGGRRLPGTARLDLRHAPEGRALRPGLVTGWEYSDGWVDDARLVVLNARDAEARGATILPRTEVLGATVDDGIWTVTLRDASGLRQQRARALVNAAGPWTEQVLTGIVDTRPRGHVRLVRGAHIVTRRLFDHDKAYFLQGPDARIVFVIPYEDDFTLIGTTDADHPDPDTPPVCTEAERDYLCAAASRWLARPVTPADVVWSFAGVRPLYDDGARSATAATRDYVLTLDDSAGAPVLSVFGGKITTYRRLAEATLTRLSPHLPAGGPWTAGVPLPGGDLGPGGPAALADDLRAAHPFLTPDWSRRLARLYGTEARALLNGARSAADLGAGFGADLTEAEVRWLVTREFAGSADDILWRRTKLGLRLSADQVRALERWLAENL